MMSDQQKEALALLAEVWKISPDVRLGQLFAHLGFLGEAHLGRGLGYIDDDELISVLYRHRAELMARLEEPTTLTPKSAGTTTSVSVASKVAEATPAAEQLHSPAAAHPAE